MKKSDFLVKDFERVGHITKTARETYAKYYNDIKRDTDLIVIVDFSQPSYKKRFFIYNVRTLKFERVHHTAHGTKSNVSKGNRTYCDKFSNKNGSRKSSLGVFVTKGVYYGRHGRSLNIEGLEKGVNNNAFTRRIVIHKAKYVTDNFILNNGRAGNSWGCFSLDPAICNDVIDLIKGGTLIHAIY